MDNFIAFQNNFEDRIAKIISLKMYKTTVVIIGPSSLRNFVLIT